MNFLDKMERKYGRYALSHLTMYIIVTYIAGYIIALAAPIMRQYLTLEPYYILLRTDLASGELDSDSAEQP